MFALAERNGVVLPFVLIFMLMLTNDRELMGAHVGASPAHATGRRQTLGFLVSIHRFLSVRVGDIECFFGGCSTSNNLLYRKVDLKPPPWRDPWYPLQPTYFIGDEIPNPYTITCGAH